MAALGTGVKMKTWVHVLKGRGVGMQTTGLSFQMSQSRHCREQPCSL